MSPFDLFSLNMKMTQLMLETQAVMTLRIMGMSGAIPAHRGENGRMIKEKGPAMAKALAAATEAVMSGKRPDQIMQATIAPLRQRVSSNRKRLMK